MTGPARPSLTISRRRLLGSGAAASVFAAVGMAAAARTSRGDLLRIASRPGWITDRLLCGGCVFEGLTGIGPDGGLQGELAGGWEARRAGAEWLFDLRADAAFHDGRPVTERDVLASLRPHQPDRLRGALQIRRAGPMQIRIVLAAPDPQFPLVLADPALAIRPAEDDRGRAGTGLFRVAEDSQPDRLRLARIGSHRRAAAAGGFDRVELITVADADLLLQALTSGRVDAAFGLGRAARATLARHRRLGAAQLRIAGPGAPATILVGHSLRLRGLEGRDPFRIAERGGFA